MTCSMAIERLRLFTQPGPVADVEPLSARGSSAVRDVLFVSIDVGFVLFGGHRPGGSTESLNKNWEQCPGDLIGTLVRPS
jgi:hypothetical protein